MAMLSRAASKLAWHNRPGTHLCGSARHQRALAIMTWQSAHAEACKLGRASTTTWSQQRACDGMQAAAIPAQLASSTCSSLCNTHYQPHLYAEALALRPDRFVVIRPCGVVLVLQRLRAATGAEEARGRLAGLAGARTVAMAGVR